MGDIFGVVPVAGFGSRLKPLTNVLPKELLPVGHHLIVERVISELKICDIRNLVFVVSPSKQPIFQAIIGDGSKFGVNIQYAVQHHMGGLADAVLCAEPYLPKNSKVLIALGDSFFTGGRDGSVTRRMIATATDGAVATREVPIEMVSRYGIVTINTHSSLIDHITEKPKPTETTSRLAVCARYLVDPSIFDIIRSNKPTDGSEHQLTDCINRWIDIGNSFANVPLELNEKRHDVGNFDTYYAATVELALEESDDRQQLERLLKEHLQ